MCFLFWSIVTMAVSVTVCEIFSVKEWCDLQNRVRVRRNFVKMFDAGKTRMIGPPYGEKTMTC